MGSPNAANVYLKETISSVVLNLCQSILVVASPQPSAASLKLAPAFSLELAKVNNKQLLAIRARAAEASNVTRQGKLRTYRTFSRIRVYVCPRHDRKGAFETGSYSKYMQ